MLNTQRKNVHSPRYFVANEFLKNEVAKISNDQRWTGSLNQAMASVYMLANFKGENLKIFDMTKSSSLCDYHIVATAQNVTQARAMADEIASQLRGLGAEILSYEGYGTADWILIDTGDVITHIFQENTREMYDLDRVFGVCPQIAIPEEFYFSGPIKRTTEETLKGYF